MADFVNTNGTLNQAADSFQTVAHKLSAVWQRFAKRQATDIELMQNFIASKKHRHPKDDPWILLEVARRDI